MKATEKISFLAIVFMFLAIILMIAWVWSGSVIHFKASVTCWILFGMGFYFWKFLKWKEEQDEKQ